MLSVDAAAVVRDDLRAVDITARVRAIGAVGALWARCGGELATMPESAHPVAGTVYAVHVLAEWDRVPFGRPGQRLLLGA
ncbi:hypothetical protein ALI22I_30710 [Saccharothrix sp. ALI-22-I]|uniref:hypothetical protein n=1 Tax=Saccharothrix sp. ALI-22-I TaxID=1933778 RepID=UPI00097C4AFF|nr:hypothetical protein [Saccharothrix sp. ALI-22-I]ONI84854.1 hypothetical protein ALI22I_30710 [Saccharothrix sp. ALI-22-I]